MAKVKGLNISRREFRGLLAENYGKRDEPGGEPWFGEGRFVQHLTPGLFSPIGFCGRSVAGVSSLPIGTLTGRLRITCPGCTRVLKKINRRIESDNNEVHFEEECEGTSA